MFYLIYQNDDPYSYDIFETINLAYKYIYENGLENCVRPVYADKEYYPQFKHCGVYKIYKGEQEWKTPILNWFKGLLNIGKA